MHIGALRALPELDFQALIAGSMPTPSPSGEATAALLETERLRALLSNIGLGVLVEDEGRRVSLANQAFCDLFAVGLAPERLHGFDCAVAAVQAAALVEHPEAFLARIDALLASAVPVTGDEVRLRDGRVLERDYIPISVNHVGRGHLWVYRDVTRVRQLAELERAAAVRDELRLAVDTIPGLVWSSRPDGFIDFLSQYWCEYTGMSLEAASGWGWEAAIHPEDHAGLREYWTALLAAGQPGQYEARLRRFDGAYRWFLFRGVPLRNERGEIVKWYGQTTDIDDRKRAEALLAGEKKLLEMLARGAELTQALDALCQLVESNAPGCLCSVLVVDPTGTKLEIGAAPSLPASYNEALCKRPLTAVGGPCGLSAVSKSQVIVDDVSSERRFDESGWCALASANGLASCWSTPIRTRDARVLGTFALYRRVPGRPGEWEQHLIEQLSNLASIVIERKHSEEALQRAQAELSHVTRVTTLGELAASIAHEVNQPLAAMVADASACLNWLSEERLDLDKARESLCAIVNEGVRAGGVLNRIRALLTRSSLSQGRCAVRHVTESALELLRAELARQRIELRTTNLAPNAEVLGDAIELQQVILNLVLNAAEAARDFERERRVVEVHTRLDTRGGRPFVVVSVQDAGVGIDEGDLDRVFMPFYTTKPGGLGMGLAIIRSIIERHGGTIRARSQRGEGSTFEFSLPTAG